jgi:hypothetical protein
MNRYCTICHVTELPIGGDTDLAIVRDGIKAIVCGSCFEKDPKLIEIICECHNCQTFKEKFLKEHLVMEWDK